MGTFLKKILEPSEQDAFDHLTWMEKPCISISAGLSSEDALPSPNVGLPGALIPRQPPGPAYVTHTGPLVRLLLQQERLGRARPAPPQPRSEPRGAAERSPERSRGGSTAGIQEHSAGIPEEKSALAPPSVCHRVIFAGKTTSTVVHRSNLACSSQRE